MLVLQNKMHSVSDAGTLKISNTETGEQGQEILPSHPNTFALKAIMDLPGRNAYCVSDAFGQFHLLRSTDSEPIMKCEGETTAEIRGIAT
jgi:hypothetical protein